MNRWLMLTVIGTDKPGIVANITQILYDHDCTLGEASMIRLGGNFTIMLMVESKHSKEAINQALQPITQKLHLNLHIDDIEGELHATHIPDTMIIVSGADKAGIVAPITHALFKAGFDILDLNSNVAGSDDKPIYIMQIEGISGNNYPAVKKSMESFCLDGTDIQTQKIDTIIG